MKIRIKGNSVRLRLSRTEVEKLAISGSLEERTCFGNNVFFYALETTTHGNQIAADFNGSKITLFIPAAFIIDWPVNEIVGWDATIPVSESESLYLLIEKDFQCLEERVEDQSDNFENPNKSC